LIHVFVRQTKIAPVRNENRVELLLTVSSSLWSHTNMSSFIFQANWRII